MLKIKDFTLALNRGSYGDLKYDIFKKFNGKNSLWT